MRFVFVLMAVAVSSGTAFAQTAPSPAAPSKGYASVDLQSAFGNVTSQSYGAEGGATIRPNLMVFGEFGQTRNVAPLQLSNAAQTFAGGLSAVASNVGYTVKAPVTFGVGGVKLQFPLQGSKAMPYVLAGAGIASVNYDTTFSVGGIDVTTNLAQFGAILGTDVSGSFTKPMFVFGGGFAIPVWQQVVVDLQFRFGRIMAEDEGINVSRLGLGFGYRF